MHTICKGTDAFEPTLGLFCFQCNFKITFGCFCNQFAYHKFSSFLIVCDNIELTVQLSFNNIVPYKPQKVNGFVYGRIICKIIRFRLLVMKNSEKIVKISVKIVKK